MKRLIICVLLCALALTTIAQEQEDVVVRRGSYQQKQKKERNSEWYNQISVSYVCIDKDDYKDHNNTIDDVHTVFSIGLAKYKKINSFYVGPGFHAKVDGSNSGDIGYDLFAHFEYKNDKETFMGFSSKNVQPVIGTSLGLQYVLESGTPKLFFDYNLGLSIKVMSHSYIQLSYYASLLDGFWQKRHNNTLSKGYKLILCHGAEISYRF